MAASTPAEILAVSPDLALAAEFALIELLGGTKAPYLRARRTAHGLPRVSRKTLNENFARFAAPAVAALHTPFIKRSR